MAEPVQPVGQPESTEPAPAAMPTRARNYALDLLRIVSIVGVVAIHSFGELAGDDSARNQPDWIPAAVIDIAFIWVVPVFVIISGTLTLAPRAHAAGAGDFYRKRALRLVPALIFWHLVYIFVGRAIILERELNPAEPSPTSSTPRSTRTCISSGSSSACTSRPLPWRDTCTASACGLPE
ncbi:acyltransferase [Arthrobacter crystallopoietes]|uniref:acyltransferase n=1 Tax=Crystallibacter crystallopoietes TaxID=37928 RepID=UPI0011114FB2|nr:acyltransferase [Arthrobacter crystallopoietes]